MTALPYAQIQAEAAARNDTLARAERVSHLMDRFRQLDSHLRYPALVGALVAALKFDGMVTVDGLAEAIVQAEQIVEELDR